MSNDSDSKRGASAADGHGEADVAAGSIDERIERRWQQAYSVHTEDELQAFYDDWAREYDVDHETVGCDHHVTAAEVLSRHLPDRAARILDVGAGTGLAGIELRRLGYGDVSAVDFSQAMLDVARERDLYRAYWVMNLNRPLPGIEPDSFDAAIGVGIFSYGQVENGCLDELLRIVRPGGCIAFTERTDFHESNEMGFRERQEALEQSGRWELLELTDPAPYLPEKEPDAMYRVWLYRVIE